MPLQSLQMPPIGQIQQEARMQGGWLIQPIQIIRLLELEAGVKSGFAEAKGRHQHIWVAGY